MPRKTLAAFDLKAARKMRGLSQVQVAELLCTTQPTIARWEAQGNMPEAFRKVWALHWQLQDMDVSKLENHYGKAKETNAGRAASVRVKKVSKHQMENIGGPDSALQDSGDKRIMGRRGRSRRYPRAQVATETFVDGTQSASEKDAARG